MAQRLGSSLPVRALGILEQSVADATAIGHHIQRGDAPPGVSPLALTNQSRDALARQRGNRKGRRCIVPNVRESDALLQLRPRGKESAWVPGPSSVDPH